LNPSSEKERADSRAKGEAQKPSPGYILRGKGPVGATGVRFPTLRKGKDISIAEGGGKVEGNPWKGAHLRPKRKSGSTGRIVQELSISKGGEKGGELPKPSKDLV